MRVLVLDLNGVLLRREYDPSGTVFAEHSRESDYFYTGKYTVQLRPFVRKFLELVSREYEIVVWSSMSERNIKDIMRGFAPKQRFVYLSQEDALYDEEKDVYIKILSVIQGMYNVPKSMVTIVDDSPEKISPSDVDNYIQIPTFTGNRKDNELRVLLNKLITCTLSSFVVTSLDNRQIEEYQQLFPNGYQTDYLLSLTPEKRAVLEAWIYGDYLSFNHEVGRLNLRGNALGSVLKEYILSVADPYIAGQVMKVGPITLMREIIQNAPSTPYTLFTWKMMKGVDMILKGCAGDRVTFSRFISSSVSREDLYEEGVLLILEVPPETPYIDVSSLRMSTRPFVLNGEAETEIVIPDMSIFEIVSHISDEVHSQAFGEVKGVHLRLSGFGSGRTKFFF